jgi:uncharacterized protein (TIGR03437 family)
LTVSPGTLAAAPASLTFSQVAGGPAPAAQNLAVSGSPGALSFTVATSTSDGNPWLTATPASGTTNATVQVSVSAGTLAVGTYTGAVTVTSVGATGSPVKIPVTLNVVAPQTLTVSPTQLNFASVIGAPPPQGQTVAVSAGSAGTAFSVTAKTTDNGNWLQVSPTSGVTPNTLAVTVNPQGLAAGNYTGTVTVSSPASLTAATVSVTLAVTAIPQPVVTAVKNAASYATGAVAPGENIVIGGTGIGPATLVGLQLTSTGAVATTVANTQVLFDAIPAPIVYVSSTQSSVMVPYEIAGRATTNLQVVFMGVASAPVAYNVAAAGPGIYTLNQQGNGPGAILNQDFSINGPGKPASAGSVVAIYMTGEGQTAPPGVTGSVIPANGSLLKNPLLKVTATVGGLPATVAFAGSAPGFVSGVLQVNVIIPAGLTSGQQAVVVTLGDPTAPSGSFSSQAGVTVTVQ